MSVRRLLCLCALAVLTCLGLAAPAAASAAPAHATSVIATTSVAAAPAAVSAVVPAAVAMPAIAPGALPAVDDAETPAPGISVNLEGGPEGRSQGVTIIVLMTILSIAPSILLLMTSFTKIAVVLALTRQAIGTPTIPPNQVIAGVALFLSLFVMGPVVNQVNEQAIQPYLNGSLTMTEAFSAGEAPLRTFMLRQTGEQELQTMVTLNPDQDQPANPEDVAFTTLVPAFVLSELKTAFIIGFVIFVPFLVIDLVVASVLMSMGMMMLPPIMISMPFKILLFIMVDGWSLITTALVSGYMTT